MKEFKKYKYKIWKNVIHNETWKPEIILDIAKIDKLI